ncbi:radical SAM protein [Sphingomonas sp. ZT3P38]|uniref:radical SAM protein n=1 Tax=Parasphingomonas zepuensis TaxID=3096161 RepID=UPI002FCA7716
MTVEVRPLGDKCNIKCRYCYQENVRTAGNIPAGYDIDAVIERLADIGQPFSLFGGEIMMTPRRDIERLLALGLDRHGGTGLQTNGTLVEPDDIDLFRTYHVRVGISIDGPGPLNDARWAGTLAATRRATARTEALIETLCREGMPPNIIVTLNRINAGARLDELCEWLEFLDGLGIRRVRLHTLEKDDTVAGDGLPLSDAENIAVLRRMRTIERGFGSIAFDLFGEMRALLLGDDRDASCIFHACDPYATQAVVGVEGDGSLGNCGRTTKDGVGHLQAANPGYERQLGLYRTPMADGGCAGCRFFLMCKGNCPGTALAGDWRLRSSDCAVWFALFEDIESEMTVQGKSALSLSPARPAIERALVEAWEMGANPSLASLCEVRASA